MFNRFHLLLRPTQNQCRYVIILFILAFGFLALMPAVKAQDGGPDPATSVEVSSTTIWRDAVSTGSVTVTCYDTKGNVVPNDAVTISISSPGEITDQSGSSYTYSSTTTGTTDSNGTVTVTAKSTDLTLVGNNATATVTASADGVSGTGSVLFNGALQLLCNNVNVANQTQMCNIGEQQLLQAKLLSGISCTASWTASGATPIGGWSGNQGSASVTTPFSKSGGLTSLFLTTVGNDNVTLSAYDGAATGAATTNFTVSIPTDFAFSASQASPAVGTDVLSLGSDAAKGITNGTLGISFSGSGGSAGTLSFAQILNTNNVMVTDKYGTGSLNPVVQNQDGLDKNYPYPTPIGAVAGITNDNPSSNQQDISTTDIHYNSFSAKMYLMWTSSRAGAIAIPVMSISWTWNAEATFDPSTGKGTLKPNGSSSTTIKGKAVPATMGVLTWTQTWNAPASR